MRVAAFAILLILVAGCLGGAKLPDSHTFSATGGKASLGWAYDGVGLVPSGATLEGQVKDSANTGSVNVSFDLNGEHWIATFDTFAQAAGKDFQNGGVRFGFNEHGDSKNGDASIPLIHADVAAWGTAKVMAGGKLATPEPWSAHLMLSKDSVRGADNKITKADGKTPYDPAAPTDARVIANDKQAFFYVIHPKGANFTRGSVPVGANLTCGGPQCTQTGSIPFEEGAKTLQLNVSFISGGQVPLAVGRATIDIKDANGTAVLAPTQVTLTPGTTPGPTPVTADPSKLVPPLTVTVSGDGSFTAAVEGSVTYADTPFVVITWDDYAMS